jgi:tRNA A37 threonylcarbamoyladenosine biosynthesis protein TsaE
LAHIDLYRLDSAGEIQSLGLLEQENRLTVLVIEWADKALSQLPPERMQIEFLPEGEFKRRIIMSVFGNQYLYLLKA